MKNLLQSLFITANTLTTTKDISYVMRGDDNNYYIFLEIYNFNDQDKMTLRLLKQESIHNDILLLEIEDKEKEISDFSNDTYGLSDLVKEKNKKINIDSVGKNKKCYLILKDDCEQRIKKEFLNILVIIQKYQSKCLDCEDALIFIPFEEKFDNNEIRKDVGSNKGCRFIEKSGQPFYFESCSEAQYSWINALVYQYPNQRIQSKILLNALNLSFFSNETEKKDEVPFMAIISKDHGASGFIDTLSYGSKEKIPEGEVFSGKYSINNESAHYINPLDICFGHDKPLGAEMFTISQVLSYITGNEIHAGLLLDIVESLYIPKYVKTESIPEIKTLLLKEGENSEEISWIEIRNILARSGKNELFAWYAHKQAMPTLKDFMNALGKKRDGEFKVFDKDFERAILKAEKILKNNVFASCATNINIDYREHITHMILSKNEKEAELGYIVASSHLFKQFLLNSYDDVSNINEDCKPIMRKYINKFKNAAKRVVLDDADIAFSKRSNNSLQHIINIFAREARKCKMDLTILLSEEDYKNEKCDEFKQFITSSFKITCHEDKNSIYSTPILSNKNKDIVLNSYFDTKSGEINPVLYFNLSPVEYWAVTTIRTEVNLRNKLYAITSVGKARKILADAYPEGLLMAQYNEDYNENEVLEYLLQRV